MYVSGQKNNVNVNISHREMTRVRNVTQVFNKIHFTDVLTNHRYNRNRETCNDSKIKHSTSFYGDADFLNSKY